jgi:hypothetical protein
MSKILGSILDQPERSVKKLINKLEAKNGYPSHDVRHLAENIQKTRLKIAGLGLDPDDTTGQELHHALLVKFQKGARAFDAQNNLSSRDFNSKATTAIELVTKNIDLPERWALKSGAIKNLLRQHPPKRLMKRLNYRSLESMLKRESLCELLLASQAAESPSWQKELARAISKLDSSSFELRTVSIKSLSRAKWGALDSPSLIYDEHTGSLGLIESSQPPDMPLLSMVVRIVEELGRFKQLDLSSAVAKLSPTLAWWSDTGGLIANLDSEQVSLSINDVSRNALEPLAYERRSLDGSRRSFWQKLLQRYDNQLEIEEDLLAGLKDQVVSFKAPINQPVFEYEYVEDL